MDVALSHSRDQLLTLESRRDKVRDMLDSGSERLAPRHRRGQQRKYGAGSRVDLGSRDAELKTGVTEQCIQFVPFLSRAAPSRSGAF
jgi:hypothetical protein